MKVVNEELDAARRDVKKPQNHCQMLQQKSNLKQLYTSKYVLLKSENDLTQEQQLKLEAIQQVSPLLARMHSLKEEFRDIWKFTKLGRWDSQSFRLASICKTDFRKVLAR